MSKFVISLTDNLFIILSINFLSDSSKFWESFFVNVFSEITIVISPLNSNFKVSRSSTLVLKYSSKYLVISRQIKIFLPEKFFFKYGIILLNFFDETKNTIEEFSFDKFSKSLINNFFFLEKTHKKNLSEKPLTETADVTDEGPGIGIMFISCLTHSFIKITPGSDILGVPASEIIDITDPAFNNSIIRDKFFSH